MRLFSIHSVVLPAVLAIPATAQVAPPPDFDAYVSSVMERFEVPGLSVAIVKDGEVVLAKGYGVRTLGSSDPVAAKIIAAVSGTSWEEFVATRILGPVGMDGSDVRLSHPDSVPNAATTHARVDGVVQAVSPYLGDAVNPAGGIFSNAADMARWVLVQLDSGAFPEGIGCSDRA